jgi:hypothetical protein
MSTCTGALSKLRNDSCGRADRSRRGHVPPALRKREDFQKLMQGLEAKGKQGGP